MAISRHAATVDGQAPTDAADRVGLARAAVNGEVARVGATAVIDHLLRAACDHLDMDIAYLTEFVDGEQRFHSIVGDARPFGFGPDHAVPLEDTYCHRMITGQLDDVIPDTAEEPAVSELAATKTSGLRAYAAAPVRLADGRLYGTMCCASQRPQPDIGESEVRLLRAMAEVIATLLERDDPYRVPVASVRSRIARCLRQRTIDVHFQPIVDLAHGRVVGVEALSRFPDEPRQSPDVWFAEAAKVGLGVELELLACELALGQGRELPVHVDLALNVSPQVILDDRLSELLLRSEHPLERTVLEITEHAAAADRACIKDRLGDLQRRGLRIAIDDAGSGFASLESVVEFAPDIIKADISLVRGVAADPVRRALLAALAAFADDAGRTLIAEGIEDRDTLATLRELGVAQGQGWLFAPASPLPLAQLEHALCA